jgi:hypothetical protein
MLVGELWYFLTQDKILMEDAGFSTLVTASSTAAKKN